MELMTEDLKKWRSPNLKISPSCLKGVRVNVSNKSEFFQKSLIMSPPKEVQGVQFQTHKLSQS